MENGRILGIDLGTKRIGVAVSDESGIFSFPLKRIDVKANSKQWVDEIKSLVEEYQVKSVVVGIPLNTYGEIGPAASKIQKNIALLQEKLNCPVIEWDESYTTAEAERTLIEADISRKKRRQVVDKLAATILLQNYLDQKARLTPLEHDFR